MLDARRLRVVHISATPAPYRAYELDSVQDELRTETEILALFLERHWGDIRWTNDMPRTVRHRVLTRRTSVSLRGQAPEIVESSGSIRAVLEEEAPDVLVIQGYASMACWKALWWAKARGVPVLFRSDANVLCQRQVKHAWYRNLAKRALVGHFFQQVNGFLTIGATNEAYYALYGVDSSRLFPAAFMFDAHAFSDGAQAERNSGRPLRGEVGIREKFVATYVGRLVEEKGLPTLVNAVRAVRAHGLDLALAIVGDGPLREWIQEISGVGGGGVYWRGFQQAADVARLYGASDVVVLPSLREPWGFVVCEAMACSVPVIASRQVGAAQELVEPGVTGEMFNAGDAEELASRLTSLLSAPKILEEMGAAAYRRLERYYREWNGPEGYRKAIAAVLP